MKLTLPPDKASYVATDGEEVVSTKLDGGASRTRKDILNSTTLVNVQWTVGRIEFEYLRRFYRYVTQNGALSFTMDLLLDTQNLTEHICKFIPNTFQSRNPSGHTYSISAQIEVKPLIPDDEQLEITKVELYNQYGPDWEEQLNGIINDALNLVTRDISTWTPSQLSDSGDITTRDINQYTVKQALPLGLR